MDLAGDPFTRVQTLAMNNLSEVPTQYIQPPENRPQNPAYSDSTGHKHVSSASVPVIDLFEFDPQHLKSGQVRQEIQRVCAEWGAFQVINHCIPTHLLDDMRRVGLSFFKDCPMSEKCKYACDPNSTASEGYGSRMLVADNGGRKNEARFVLDWRDYFDHHTLPLSRRNPSRWPCFPPNYAEVVAQYSDCAKSLAQKLLGLVSESLGLPPSCIEDAVGEFYQNITVSYYPPCVQPELTLGLQAHSDMGAITLLIQDDVGGLQVFKDADWVTVQPLPHAIVVILADQTEIGFHPYFLKLLRR
ncbi:jasmonate-induced oxygenase 1 isoform X2 [Malania oleifera]|uniref:jasmonate-induced oxygenase 1 isoform X2 n=1 Tax=Malania oleifera TaxID=397392 RepID=UPI0025ADADBE|nr:jasmonate-induced oxygenase 1 isoform X2 [Malania oleifera]XP_057956192.1 jasmonate-induced oxygenase 1 isoform X2 [Malania oleifera]